MVVWGIDDPHDAVACGLCLGGDDGDTLSHEEVHQRRLPDVGVAYDIDETRAVLGIY